MAGASLRQRRGNEVRAAARERCRATGTNTQAVGNHLAGTQLRRRRDAGEIDAEFEGAYRTQRKRAIEAKRPTLVGDARRRLLEKTKREAITEWLLRDSSRRTHCTCRADPGEDET